MRKGIYSKEEKNTALAEGSGRGSEPSFCVKENEMRRKYKGFIIQKANL